jgi:hypothetical protein
MRKVVIFGATGRVGVHLVRQALSLGYEVSAFVRRLPDYQIEHERFRLVWGNVLNAQAVYNAISGQDIVVSALGSRDIFQPLTLISEGSAHMLAAMEAQGVQRIVAVGGVGALLDRPGELRLYRPDFPPFLFHVSQDHVRVYDLLRRSRTYWTYVCPPNISPNEASGNYVARLDYFPETGMHQINAGDVAAFMLREALENRFVCRRVGLAGF